MRTARLVLAALLGFAATAAADDKPEADPAKAGTATPDAVDGITARELGGHLRFIASDRMRGRDTPSPEIEVVAELLAGQLAGDGAEPMGDKGPDGEPTFFQRFPLDSVTPTAEGTSVTLKATKDGEPVEKALKLFDDFQMIGRGAPGGTVSGPIYFAGDQAPEDLKDDDVKGKILVLGGGERRFNPFAARGLGDKGVLAVISLTSLEDRIAEFARSSFGRESITMGGGDEGRRPSGVPLVFLGEEARKWLADNAGLAGDKTPGPIDGLTAEVAYNAKLEEKSSPNVVGFFPGSDPEKRKEIVIYSAHFDHVGVGADGQIYNGSDDNGSGTSALLEVAEAFGDGPRPARSVAFLWVSGEEKGLYGSAWFADHMTVPEGYKIVADVNMDMVSRNDPKKISLTPSPKHPSYNDLSVWAQDACAEEGIEPVYDADQFFGRTDSANFARKGIPIVFFFSGTHEDYHQPGDDFPKADLEKAARIARIAYRLGWRVATAPDVPRPIKAEEGD